MGGGLSLIRHDQPEQVSTLATAKLSVQLAAQWAATFRINEMNTTYRKGTAQL